MLKAPFTYFGGKSKAAEEVWAAFGDVKNYVEPFCGSAAMLLCAPDGKRIETVNDLDAHIANFWRAVQAAPDEVARYADWPVIEADLFARHMWLVSKNAELNNKISADQDYYDAKTAGWWVWGKSCWLGADFCSGDGPWRVVDGVPSKGGRPGVRRKLQHLGDAGSGVNRQIPHLGDAGQCAERAAWLQNWLRELADRLRGVRVASGDWRRVCTPVVTHGLGLTAVFLDPPYTKGAMDYAVGGVGGELANEVRAWCHENGANPLLRIVLCGHAGEHDALLEHGWHTRQWTAGRGYALSDEARGNAQSETLWCSPHCVPELTQQQTMF